MPRMKLTKSSIDALPIPESDVVYWDLALPGFGVKVTPKHRKVFIVLYRAAGAGSKLRKYTIGPYGRITLHQARIAAQTLIAEAETASGLTMLRRARMVRNGVMVLVLACCPIRLKNFAALEVGRSFVKIDNVWWVILTAEETKEKGPDERPTWDYLSRSINLYIESYRPILADDRPQTNCLWLTDQGTAMTPASVAETVTETTRLTVGTPISPHLFRTCGASTAAVYAGDNPHLASAILHHKNSLITEQDYSRAKSMNAAMSYCAITDTYRNN